MTQAAVRSIGSGLSQKGVRNHNERLLLSLLQRHGEQPGSDLARLSGLSPPTVSTILKRLEHDGLLERGVPTRGRVGKPSIPLRLAPGGALSFGLKIGRRSADLLLMDMTGTILQQRRFTYDHPVPDDVFDFLATGLSEITAALTPASAARICGIGVGMPFEMWNDNSTAETAYQAWRGLDLRNIIARFSALPVMLMNDATAACQAEHVYGRGKEFRDYAYVFVGTFLGGGIVLNHSVYEGRLGNAGAIGSLRTIGPNGEALQLVDTASIHRLEARLKEVDLDPRILWRHPQDWSDLTRYVDPWLGQTAQELARASLSICSIIDFEAIVIDGAFPEPVRGDLTDRVRRYLSNQDMRGLVAPRIEEGTIGGNARAIGAASGPFISQYLLNSNIGQDVA